MKSAIIWLTAILSVTASAGLEESRAELAAAKERWEQRGARTYSFTIWQHCFCGGHASGGPARVVVQGGVITKATFLGESRGSYRKGGDFTEARRSLRSTIPQLFRLVDAHLQADSRHKIEVAYDATTGHPTRISIWNEELEDDFLVLEITDFVSMTANTSLERTRER